MNAIIEKVMGMDKMTDQVIATDFFLAAKNGVRAYAIAITETTTPEVRAALKKQLNAALATYDTISNYMIKKGYYLPYNTEEQIRLDMETTSAVMKLT